MRDKTNIFNPAKADIWKSFLKWHKKKHELKVNMKKIIIFIFKEKISVFLLQNSVSHFAFKCNIFQNADKSLLYSYQYESTYFFFLEDAISTLRMTNTRATERRNLRVTLIASSLRPGVYLFWSSLTKVPNSVSINWRTTKARGDSYQTAAITLKMMQM